MANDKVDSNKVVQDLAALKGKDSLQTAMNDMATLKHNDGLDDPQGQKGTWEKDRSQIQKSVDLKGLGLDGFHVSDYAEVNNGKVQLMEITKDGPNGTKDVRVIDQNGTLYTEGADKTITQTKNNVFDQTTPPAAAPTDGSQPPAAAPADRTQPPAAAPNDGSQPPAAAPTDGSQPAAAGDKSFGTHGRTFDVGADGKAVYTAKHGDTYWSVAKDLLAQDGKTHSNAEVLAAVKSLATLNSKDDANKLKVGEQIVLPITPPAPEAPPPAAPPAKAPEVAPPGGTPPAAAAPDAPPPAGAPAPEAVPPPAAPAPAPAAALGFDMKAHADALKPQNDVFSPLSPYGMSGSSLDSSKATSGDVKKPETKDGVTTQETDFKLNDGYIFNWGATGVTNKDVMNGNVLQSRETKYDSAVNMKMAGPNGPVELNGVTDVKTTLDQNGNYQTDVTAAQGNYHFVTDSSGKVQRMTDFNQKVSTLEAPAQSDLLASLSLDTPPAPAAPAAAVADNGPKVPPPAAPGTGAAIDVP